MHELVSLPVLLVVKWGQSSLWWSTYSTHSLTDWCLWLTVCRGQVTTTTEDHLTFYIHPVTHTPVSSKLLAGCPVPL